LKTFKLREAEAKDAELIARFNAAMALETEHLVLDEERLLQGVKAVFEDESKGFYLVVECEDKVIACLLITKEWSDWRNSQSPRLISFRSAPAVNDFPSPLKIATQRFLSSRKSIQILINSLAIAILIAFKLSGRFNLIIFTKIGIS